MAETPRPGYRTQRPRTIAEHEGSHEPARGVRAPSQASQASQGDTGEAGRDTPLGWANIARAARGLPPTTETEATATDWALGRLLKEEAMLRHDMGRAAKRLAEIAKQRADIVAGEQPA
jgi:hypothetical protein